MNITEIKSLALAKSLMNMSLGSSKVKICIKDLAAKSYEDLKCDVRMALAMDENYFESYIACRSKEKQKTPYVDLKKAAIICNRPYLYIADKNPTYDMLLTGIEETYADGDIPDDIATRLIAVFQVTYDDASWYERNKAIHAFVASFQGEFKTSRDCATCNE